MRLNKKVKIEFDCLANKEETEDSIEGHTENKYQTKGIYDPTKDAEGKKIKTKKKKSN